jgi:tRNA modification GTPase
LTGAGLDLLKSHLLTLAGWTGEVTGTFSARRRHLDAIGRAQRHLHAARAELDGALELVAEELRGAQTALSELTGEITSDDLLGEIFATFCIGK